MASIPEMRFQALCCPSANRKNHDLLGNFLVPDWVALLESATWHGMMPLLASHLLPGVSSPSRSDLPEFVVKALRTYQERHLFRSVTQTAALLELQDEFARAGLRILPWKGPSVGVLLYGSATLRESVDLDFLFRNEDIQQVLEIVRRLGYQLLGNPDSESKYLYTLALQREFSFGRKRDHLVLEFHSQILTSRFSRWQNSQGDIERASTICRLANHEILMQRPEDLLVSLCAHATKHNWDRLKWSCDIAQFLGVYGDTLDWTPFLADLRRTQKDSVVLLGLSLAASLFDLLLPTAVQKILRQNPDVARITEGVAANIMSGSKGLIEVRLQKAMVAFLCPRLRDRITYTLRPIVELNYDDLSVPVHNPLFFMNYAFRVVRLLRKYGPFRLASKTAVSVRAAR